MGLLIVFPLFIGLVAVFGAAFLRAAVALANMFVSESPPTAQVVEPPPSTVPKVPTSQSDSGNPFAAPLARPVMETSFLADDRIPTPSILKAIGLCLVMGVAHMVVSATVVALLATSNAIPTSSGASLLALPINAIIALALLKAFLPTSWKRSALVVFFFVALWIGVVILTGGAVAFFA